MWKMNNGKYENDTCNKCCCDCVKIIDVINYGDTSNFDCDCCEKEDSFYCEQCKYEND